MILSLLRSGGFRGSNKYNGRAPLVSVHTTYPKNNSENSSNQDKTENNIKVMMAVVVMTVIFCQLFKRVPIFSKGQKIQALASKIGKTKTVSLFVALN